MEKFNKLFESLSITTRVEREKITPIVSIAAAAAIIYSTYRVVSIKRRNTKKQGLKEIPSPGSSYPYVGHMFSLGGSPGIKIAEWHKKLGHIIQLRMGIQTWVLIDDPVLAHKVFVTHGAASSNRPHFTFAYEYYSHQGKGVSFAPPMKNWNDARAAVLSIIAPKVVDKAYIEPIKEESIALTDRFIKYSKIENGVSTVDHLHLNSMNIIFQAGFGVHFSSIEDPEFKILSDIGHTSVGLAAIEEGLPSFFPILGIFQYFSGKLTFMKDFIENKRDPKFRQLIEEALKKDEPNLAKSLGEFNFTDEEKLVIMADLINGGSDTVAVTLSWIFAILCNYSLVQKNAADEIDTFVRINGSLPDFAERTEVPYCTSLMKECMRFKPSTPFGIPHVTNADILVDDYFIPKGTTVISSMESMHQNPEVYSEPLRFYPERFMDNLKTMDAAAKGKLEERDHYIFGWGRRTCPGIYMAEVELFTTFVQVISRCTLEPVRDKDGKELFPSIKNTVAAGLTLVPVPHKINFVERKNPLTK